MPQSVTVQARIGDTLLDALIDNGIDLEHECGGNCTCTTCHVLILEGEELLTSIEEPEEYRLQFAEGVRKNSRLACQAILRGGPVVVEILP
jgi:ferredoxin, 2Fe-2S